MSERVYVMTGQVFAGAGGVSCVVLSVVSPGVAVHLVDFLQFTGFLTLLDTEDNDFFAFGSRFGPLLGFIPWFPRAAVPLPPKGGRRLLEEQTTGHEGVDKLAVALDIAFDDMHSVILVSLMVFACFYFIISLAKAKCKKRRRQEYYLVGHQLLNFGFSSIWLFACLAQRNHSLGWIGFGSIAQLSSLATLWHVRKRVSSLENQQSLSSIHFSPYYADLKYDMRLFFLVTLSCRALAMVWGVALPISNGIRLVAILLICAAEAILTIRYKPFTTPLLNWLKSATIAIRLIQLILMFFLPASAAALMVIILSIFGQVGLVVCIALPRLLQYYKRRRERTDAYQLRLES